MAGYAKGFTNHDIMDVLNFWYKKYPFKMKKTISVNGYNGTNDFKKISFKTYKIEGSW